MTSFREKKVTNIQFYQSNQQQDELTDLITEYAPLVKRIAEQIKHKCPPSVDLDDLIQSGIIGLLQAHQNYLEDKGASFKTYASLKIRYAVYEGLRNSSGVTRDIAQYTKQINATVNKIEQSDNSPLHGIIAEHMGVSQKQYQKMTEEISAQKTISYDALNEEIESTSADSKNPFNNAANEELTTNMKSMLKALPKREQIILSLYYNDFLNFKEIGEILQLTEARVSQIHHQLLEKLKTRFKEMYTFLQE